MLNIVSKYALTAAFRKPEAEEGTSATVEGLREIATEYLGRKPKLNDAQLEAILDKSSDDWDDADWQKAIDVAEANANPDDAETTEEPVTEDEAKRHLSRAKEAAEKAGTNEAFNAEMRGMYERKEGLLKGPINIKRILEETFTKAELDAWPEVGSKKNKDNPQANANVFTDLYPVKVKTGAGFRTVNRSFYADVIDNMAVGKTVMADIRNLENKADKYKGFDKLNAKSELKKLKARQTALKTALIDAVKLRQGLHASETYEGVRVAFLRVDNDDPKSKLLDVTAPICVQKVNSVSQFETFTVRQFNQLDWAAAETKGGGYENLIASAGSGAEEGEEGVTITVADFDKTAAVLATFFDKEGSMSKLMTELNKKDTDDLLLSIVRINSKLDYVVSKFEARINKLNAKTAKESGEEKKAAA